MVTDRSPTESIAGVDALTCPLAAPLRDLTRSNMEALRKVSSNSHLSNGPPDSCQSRKERQAQTIAFVKAYNIIMGLYKWL